MAAVFPLVFILCMCVCIYVCMCVYTHKIHTRVYPKVSGLSLTKYTLIFGIARWEVTERVMTAKLTRLTHKVAIQMHLVTAIPSVLSPGGQSGNFWIHPRVCVCVRARAHIRIAIAQSV
jgi:hypothetical protein